MMKRMTSRHSSGRHRRCPAAAAFSASVEFAFVDVRTTIHFPTLRVALAGSSGLQWHVHWTTLLLLLLFPMALLWLPTSRSLSKE